MNHKLWFIAKLINNGIIFRIRYLMSKLKIFLFKQSSYFTACSEGRERFTPVLQRTTTFWTIYLEVEAQARSLFVFWKYDLMLGRASVEAIVLKTIRLPKKYSVLISTGKLVSGDFVYSFSFMWICDLLLATMVFAWVVWLSPTLHCRWNG